MNKTRRKIITAIIERQEMEPFGETVADLQSVLDEEEEAFGNMPESLQEGERGQAMQSAIEQLQAAIDAFSQAHDQIAEAIAALEQVE